MYDFLGPLERMRLRRPRIDEAVNGLAQRAHAREARARERGTGQDAKPDFDEIEPARVGRRVVQVHARVPREPAIVFRFVGTQIVQNDMQLAVGIGRDDPIHEMEELDPAATAVMPGDDLSRGDRQGGEAGRCAMPFVFMGEPREGLPSLR